MSNFTPLSALLGGALIGLAAVLMMGLLGRIAGIAGILGGALKPSRDDAWRWAFLAGLVAGPLLVWVATGARPPVVLETPLTLMIASGLLVGFGTRLGAGCTSGHGVCGLARLSIRSVLAVLVFMAAGVLTASLLRPWLMGVLA